MPSVSVPLYQPALDWPISGNRTRNTVLIATIRSEMHSPTRNISSATHCQPGSQGKAQNAADRVRLTAAYRYLGLPRARIAVAGLNPHTGEGGEFGDEEIKIITPVVSTMKKKKFDVTGPLSGDTVFYYALRGDFDAVVAMYHDQGLAPLKAVAFDTGVNWTLGLPFIRTSPDHGTAYDIAGKGIANPSSMIAAIRLAKQLARNRKQ